LERARQRRGEQRRIIAPDIGQAADLQRRRGIGQTRPDFGPIIQRRLQAAGDMRHRGHAGQILADQHQFAVAAVAFQATQFHRTADPYSAAAARLAAGRQLLT